jgi:hypothetical protein
MDSANAPVLRWQPVQSAAMTLSNRRRPAPRVGGAGRGRRGASVVPAAGGGGAAAGGGAGGGSSGGGAMSSLE